MKETNEMHEKERNRSLRHMRSRKRHSTSLILSVIPFFSFALQYSTPSHLPASSSALLSYLRRYEGRVLGPSLSNLLVDFFGFGREIYCRSARIWIGVDWK